MKTLANCNPREFLRQTNKIRHSVESWLKLTDIINIRKRMPNIPAGATEEERKAVTEAQINANIHAMLDAIMEEHPDETAELLGLLCFVEPDDLENHAMTEFLAAATEMIDSPEVIGFFLSLQRLGLVRGSADAEA